MSAVRIKTTKQLESFLKILAEESVLAAQSGVGRPDEKQRQATVAKSIKQGIKDLNEVGPEEEEPPAKKAPAPAAPEAPAPAEPKKPEPAPAPAPNAGPEELNPSLDAMIDAIKDMRGGKGTSDSIVKDGLSRYFDSLEDAERIALIVMFRSIAGIMGGKFEDGAAPEPADYNVFVTRRAPEKEAGSEPVAAAKPKAAPSPASGGEEDTSPPIKVGEPVSEAYRAKIRNLLGRAV